MLVLKNVTSLQKRQVNITTQEESNETVTKWVNVSTPVYETSLQKRQVNITTPKGLNKTVTKRVNVSTPVYETSLQKRQVNITTPKGLNKTVTRWVNVSTPVYETSLQKRQVNITTQEESNKTVTKWVNVSTPEYVRENKTVIFPEHVVVHSTVNKTYFTSVNETYMKAPAACECRITRTSLRPSNPPTTHTDPASPHGNDSGKSPRGWGTQAA